MINEREVRRLLSSIREMKPKTARKRLWIIDSVLFGIDNELDRLHASLGENEKLLQENNKYLTDYLMSINNAIKDKIERLHILKTEIFGVLERKGLLCRLDLENDSDMEIPVPIKLHCTGPMGYCFTFGLLRNMIVKIVPFSFDEYWGGYGRTLLHALISSRWVGYGECGIHNRIYVREDGNLVVSHSTVRFDGVHVVELEKPIWVFIPETRRELEKVRELRNLAKGKKRCG